MQVIEDIKMVDMVNVGGTLYRADQKFEFYYADAGSGGTLDAAAAARFLQTNPLMRGNNGFWDYGGDVGAATLKVSGPVLKPEAP